MVLLPVGASGNMGIRGPHAVSRCRSSIHSCDGRRCEQAGTLHVGASSYSAGDHMIPHRAAAPGRFSWCDNSSGRKRFPSKLVPTSTPRLAAARRAACPFSSRADVQRGTASKRGDTPRLAGDGVSGPRPSPDPSLEGEGRGSVGADTRLYEPPLNAECGRGDAAGERFRPEILPHPILHVCRRRLPLTRMVWYNAEFIMSRTQAHGVIVFSWLFASLLRSLRAVNWPGARV